MQLPAVDLPPPPPHIRQDRTPSPRRRRDLSAILVLRVVGGRDTFLMIQGAYAPSCFGVSLHTLRSVDAAAAGEGEFIATGDGFRAAGGGINKATGGGRQTGPTDEPERGGGGGEDGDSAGGGGMVEVVCPPREVSILMSHFNKGEYTD
jgi:hypothetical protein